MLTINECLSASEREQVLHRSDTWAWWLVLSNWLIIILLLSLAGFYPSPLTFLFVWLVLPGRQLGLSVLMHEAGHRTLFAHRSLNQWVGQWLCALPTLNDLGSYATGHLDHHRLAGTADDPDLPNYRAYPIERRSFLRKVFRDLTGQTGFKLLRGLVRGGLSHFGGNAQSVAGSLFIKQVAVQATLGLFLWLMGIGWTWWLWFGTLMTSYMLVIRLRQIAEHAAVPDALDPDPRMNTRTVDAPAWQRFLMAPNFVNYHLEHHLLPGVPCYRLPGFRALLRRKGLLAELPVFRGYEEVLRHTVRPA